MIGSELRRVYTVAEAAALLGVGRSTAYELIARGELDARNIGRRLIVTRPTLTELLGCEPPLPAELARLAHEPSSAPAPADEPAPGPPSPPAATASAPSSTPTIPASTTDPAATVARRSIRPA